MQLESLEGVKLRKKHRRNTNILDKGKQHYIYIHLYIVGNSSF